MAGDATCSGIDDVVHELMWKQSLYGISSFGSMLVWACYMHLLGRRQGSNLDEDLD